MNDYEQAVLESVLWVVKNNPNPVSQGNIAPVGRVARRLEEEHGYSSKEGARIWTDLPKVLEKHEGVLWITMVNEGNDDVPNKILVPDGCEDDIRTELQAG